MQTKKFLCLALFFGLAATSSAANIGTNIHASPLTFERIAALPKPEQSTWKNYLKRSNRQFRADQTFLQNELKAHHLKTSSLAPSGWTLKYLSPENNEEWYRSPEARRIADVVISFQTPAGGWSKNLDLFHASRKPGQRFAPDNGSRYLGKFDNDTPRDARWSYVGTFDNNATTTELFFLAKVAGALDKKQGLAYRKSFLRGLDYIFAAQYPNGGWPQVWPLEGGYHDAITFNDGAMLHVLKLLYAVATQTNEFAFVPAKIRAKAAAGFQRGLNCLFATQVVVHGQRTVWGQQHDMLTLAPTAARNYEMPSLSSSESADIVLFLMQLPKPDSNVVVSVDAAVAWFKKTEIKNRAFKDNGDGRRLISAPGGHPLWSRYYEIGTNRPVFGDRDRSIHDDVNEISKERRNGYSWFNAVPQLVLANYPGWKRSLQ